MRTRTCQRCGAHFERPNRNPDRYCGVCEVETKDVELFALIYDDRSGIHSLHETFESASQTMKADAEITSAQCMFLVKVQGQGGARAELRREDPTSAWWDEQDARMDRAEFEAST